MAVVTEALVQMIANQVDEKGLVVWYDPEQAYCTAATELHLPNTTVARYDRSFLKLRKEIDHLLNDNQPPRLVVYVPMERTQTDSALIELDCAGVIMQPRQQPPACNTRLSVVGRNALKQILGDDQVSEIERQVESGKLSLADLNSLAEQGIDISSGVLKLIFGSANLDIAVLTDFSKTDHKKLEELRRSAILQSGRIYTAADFTGKKEADVEDLFEPTLFAKLVNAAYELGAPHEVTAASLAAADQNTERQVKQAEAAFKLLPEAIPTYDHFTPAAWLIRNPSFLDGDSAGILATLDRAEKVFTTFNAML